MGKWTRFNHFEANIFDALDKLNDLIDESDGDTQLPNIVHAFQVDLLAYLFPKKKNRCLTPTHSLITSDSREVEEGLPRARLAPLDRADTRPG